ncbi:MAG: type II/IV secretion system ATPase subunit [Candidatus Aenigmarchaeota archaeon]|nr:type II/IV secretion system ATPase subunit [Candidatus Aenigmarchaeota archaeon]
MTYEIEIKDGVLKMDCLGGLFGASFEDFDVIMARIINKLMVEGKVHAIVLSETREYEYGPEQTKLLVEIADVIKKIIKEKKLLSTQNFGPDKCKKYFSKWYSWLYNTITFQMRGDPVGAYVSLSREIRHLKILEEKTEDKICIEAYLNNVLFPIKDILEETGLIKMARPFLTGYHVGDRKIYRKLFQPLTRPNFMYTKHIIKSPKAQLITKYKVGDSDISIFKSPEKVRPIYHIVPPEFKLKEKEYILLDDARRALEQRRPHELEVKDQARMRELFKSIGTELIADLAEVRNFPISPSENERLANILTRYTAGLGIIELLLADPKIQDININSPMGSIPLYIIHQDFDECETNLIPSQTDGERWATRFKLLSGRPLDEANPVLDTEISVPGGVARVAAIAPRVSPEGLAFALRRHRFKPWTFPLYLNAGFFDPMFAGLMWFMAAYGRTILVAGTRGAGKTSLLGSLMLQIIPFYRIITSEDTFELPVETLRSLGYNVQRLKSRSVITRVELELAAEEVIRTALRLGDSCLFIGEIRSMEAKALFESMRIGAMANVVAGTVHGESAYGVFDRVVNDLGVPATSFKAADLVLVCNKLKTSDGLHSFRKVVEVTEVRKHWQKDPEEEHGFINLMEYSSKDKMLKPSDILINGESYVINEIIKRIPGWAGRWDRAWDNIVLRGKVLQTITEIANHSNKPELMEAETTVLSNQMFDTISERCRTDIGEINPERVYKEWLHWFKEHGKKI